MNFSYYFHNFYVIIQNIDNKKIQTHKQHICYWKAFGYIGGNYGIKDTFQGNFALRTGKIKRNELERQDMVHF